jgi:CRISPR-associated endonuclease Csn1
MERVLGLDLGTNSVGWALITHHDGADKPDMLAGVYVYPEPGELEDGLFVSNRLKRGQKRRARRNLRRKRDRMRKLLRILVAHGLLPENPEERASLMSSDRAGGARPYHPFALRAKGLDEPLTLYEFGRCLYHICRRRGYLSTRDLMEKHFERRLRLAASRSAHLELDEPDEEEAGPAELAEKKERSKLLTRLAEVRQRILAGEARTIGELCAKLLSDPQKAPCGVRAGGPRRKGRQNKSDPLGWRADRQLHEEEFEMLWDAQQPHHPSVLTRALRDEIRDAIFHQRPLISKRGLIGGCEFFPHRKRLPRASLLAQRCSVLQTLVNLRLRETPAMPERRLNGHEVATLADALDVMDGLTWDDVRTILYLGPEARFSEEQGARRRASKSKRTRSDIKGNRTQSVMRRVLGDRWRDFTDGEQTEIVNRLIYAHSTANVVKGLVRDFGLTEDEIRALAGAKLPEGYSNHCHRVWAALEPLMRQGMTYYEACVAAGFRQEGETTVRPPERIVERLEGVPDLRSPVVQRAVKMAFRVINAVIDRYGKPDRIRIEMPRDVARTNAEREKLWKKQEEQARDRQRAQKLLEEHHLPLGDKGINIRKVLLWQEANRQCPYEPDVQVSIEQLVQEYTIEHIVPRSRSWDDSWVNLTICPNGMNLQKGNRTPYEWLGGTPRWTAIEQHLAHLRTMPAAKKRRILQREWDEDGFANRALSDTRYISRVVHTEVAKLGVPVEVSSGGITASLRSLWELHDAVPRSQAERAKMEEWLAKPIRKDAKPRFDHRHHAVDAIITALTDRSTLQRVSAWHQQREHGIQSNRLPKPKPWPTISDDVRALVARLPIVHAPTRSVAGALHEETARPVPDAAAVQAALAALPPRKRNRPRDAVVVGKQLVRLAPDGTPLAAYDLGNNHHVVIWETDVRLPDGTPKREITVVPMIEAARRASAGLPVFDRTPPQPGWRYLMALCKSDVVSWTGEGSGLYRVSKFSVGAAGGLELVLAPLADARKIESNLVFVKGRPRLSLIGQRVALDPLGGVRATEPPDADDR